MHAVLYRAKAAGIGWTLPKDITEQELYNKLFLPAANTSNKQQLIMPEWEYIHQELCKKGVTLLLFVKLQTSSDTTFKEEVLVL